VSEKKVVFVMDKSGSMNDGAAPGTQPFTRPTLDEKSFDALSKLLRQLDADVQFNVVKFDSDAVAKWDELHTATAANVDEALAWVKGNANGKTNALQGLSKAFSMATRPDRIYFLADGEPNMPNPGGGPAEVLEAVPSMDHGRNIPVNTVLYRDGDTQGTAADFMKKLAANTGGSYVAVSYSSTTIEGEDDSTLLRCPFDQVP